MAPHRTALRFVATAATAVVCTAALSSASVAREMPGAAIASVTIDGNTIAAGVGAISRAAPLFPATDGDGGDARWIAAHVPVAARAGEAADSGRLEDSLYGVVHQTGMDGDFSTERELGGVREVILGVPAPSVRAWVIGTFQLLASATVGGTKLVDQFHSTCPARYWWGGTGDVTCGDERASRPSSPVSAVDGAGAPAFL